jgi:hypothetical protein
LESLILNNNKISKIENLSSLVNLNHLELKSNQIKRIENLDSLINIKHLTLSCNLIDSISETDIPYFGLLEQFGLFGNYLGDQNDENLNISCLKNLLVIFFNKMPLLKAIYIGGNYFSNIPNFVDIVKDHLKSLQKLDGKTINF